MATYCEPRKKKTAAKKPKKAKRSKPTSKRNTHAKRATTKTHSRRYPSRRCVCWYDDDDPAWINAPYTTPETPASVSEAWTEVKDQEQVASGQAVASREEERATIQAAEVPDEVERRLAKAAMRQAAMAHEERLVRMRQAEEAQVEAERRRAEAAMRQAAEAHEAERTRQAKAAEEAQAEAERRRAEAAMRQAAEAHEAERTRQAKAAEEAQAEAERRRAEAAMRQAAEAHEAERRRQEASEAATRQAAEAHEAERKRQAKAAEEAQVEAERRRAEAAVRQAAEAHEAERKRQEASEAATRQAAEAHEAERTRQAAAERRAQAAKRKAEEDARRKARAAAALEEHRRRMAHGRIRAQEATRKAKQLREQAKKKAAAQAAVPQAKVQREALSLFEELKGYILRKMNTGNMAVLSSISKIQNDDGTYDLLAIDDALGAIRSHFNTEAARENRQTLYTVFAARILIENSQQLVDTYNRVIQNTRRLFPEFNLIHPTHNDMFGQLAHLDCTVRRCSDEEIASEMQHGGLKHEDVPDGDLEHELEWFKEYYQTRYVDTPNGQARTLGDEYGWVDPRSVLSKNIASMVRYEKYTGSAYSAVNAILRSDKNPNYNMDALVEAFNRFAHHLVLPMYSKENMVIYRGDGLTTSEQTQTTMGFYSGGLSPIDVRGFVKNGGRMIQIHVPRGTPFLPAIVTRQDEGEIILLPGTILEKQSQMTLDNGHYAEYTVVSNPPRLSELDEATIFMNSIAHLYSDEVSDYKYRGSGSKAERKKFVDRLPASTAPAAGEAKEFVLNLVNSRYGGSW